MTSKPGDKVKRTGRRVKYRALHLRQSHLSRFLHTDIGEAAGFVVSVGLALGAIWFVMAP